MQGDFKVCMPSWTGYVAQIGSISCACFSWLPGAGINMCHEITPEVEKIFLLFTVMLIY